MIKFKALGKQYEAPRQLSDITLGRFIQYCTFESKVMPKELKEIIKLNGELSEIPENDKLDRQPVLDKLSALYEIIEADSYGETLISYYAKIVEFWSGLPYAVIMGEDGGESMNIGQLKALSLQLQTLVNTPPENVEYSPVIEFNSEIWYLPTQYMKNSTVIEYLESSQFYKLQDQLAGGQWGALASVICFLLRKKGEKYSKDLLKRRSMFLGLPMDKAYQVAFFFLKRTNIYSKLLANYTAAQNLANFRQALRD
jgi:hypothetical protein